MATVFKNGNQTDEAGVSLGSIWTRLYDGFGNLISKKNREKIATSQSGLLISAKNDDYATLLRSDRKGNLMIGNYVPELIEPFEGTSLNVQRWVATNTTFAPTLATATGYNFNPTNITTGSASAILQSQRFFLKAPRIPLQVKSRLRSNCYNNSNMDFGFGIPSGTTLLTPNGVSVRIVSGLWTVAITSNSSELVAVTITDFETGLTQLNTANADVRYYVVDIVLDDDNVIVTVQNTQTGDMVGWATIPVPVTVTKMFAATSLPFYIRVFNGATAPSNPPVLIVTEVQVLSLDWNLNLDASQMAANLGYTGGRNPFTGAQIGNHANSTAPVSATLSNTTAGYTTLDGKFQFAAVAGAITDYALFVFQVPAGSRFICEGIRIETKNTGAAVATAATELEWAMGFNSSAVSLATTNIIRRQIGLQSFPIGAAIGSIATPLDVEFKTPEVVESGRYVHVILTIPGGAATASQIIRGTVLVKGRFI